MRSSEAWELCGLLLRCMEHRQQVSSALLSVRLLRLFSRAGLHRVSDHQITIYDCDSEEQEAPDAAILTAALKGKCLLLLLLLLVVPPPRWLTGSLSVTSRHREQPCRAAEHDSGLEPSRRRPQTRAGVGAALAGLQLLLLLLLGPALPRLLFSFFSRLVLWSRRCWRLC